MTVSYCHAVYKCSNQCECSYENVKRSTTHTSAEKRCTKSNKNETEIKLLYLNYTTFNNFYKKIVQMLRENNPKY